MAISPRARVALALAALTVGAVCATALVTRALAPLVSAAPPAQREDTNPCTALVTKTLQPGTIRLCEVSDVTVKVQPVCPGLAINVVFIIDEQYKIGYSDPADRTEALTNAIDRLGVTDKGNIRVGLVTMQRGRAFRRVELTTDPRQIIGQLNIPMVSRFEAAPQCFDCGYREATGMLEDYAKEHRDTDIREFTILAPMGVYLDSVRPGILRGASMAKSRGATSITGCYAWTHCVSELRQAASSARLYLAYGQGNRLAGLLYDLVRQSTMTFLHEVHVTDLFPDAVDVFTDTVVPAAALDLRARSLRWDFVSPIEDTYTLTYRVKPLALGSWPLGEGSSVRLVDSHSLEAVVPLPAPVLRVPEICAVTPTPTETRPPDTPTATPTNTPTPTDTPTATPTATPLPPTPTPRPKPVYLPLALDEQCVPSRTYVDVALVLDLSTTMRDATSDGRRKIDVVQATARTFLDLMRLDPGAGGSSDQVAIAGFNRTAWVEQSLTADAAALRSAIDRLPVSMQEQTRLDLALRVGAEALRDPRHTVNAAALILLTDGLPNQVPYAEDGTVETTVLRAAEAAKAAGIDVYTVGVGRAGGARPEINEDLLRAAASLPSMYYHAPEAEQLAGIYRELVRVLPCGGSRYWSSH
jgi:hypothetical protein